jgi:hypothetical protein
MLRIFNFDRPRRKAISMEVDMGNRYLCEVVEEMRQCNKTRNYGGLEGLIEEAQSLASRMESALSDKGDVLSYTQRRPILKDEIKELKWKKEELEEQIRVLQFKIKETKHDNGIKED